MAAFGRYRDLGVALEDHVALVEIRRPPHNFFDHALIGALADVFEALDREGDCRAIVLASQGKAFCAGADFASGGDFSEREAAPEDGRGAAEPLRADSLYREAVRLFRTGTPIVAAVQGAAVGGGLGLAMVADLRVACPEARFCANFTRLGFHPGFGLTETLPAVIGPSKATLMFYTSRRVKGDEAFRYGLADALAADRESVRPEAMKLAAEIAENAPLGLTATRATMRAGLAERVAAATDRELAEQTHLRATADFAEGVKAMAERRKPDFAGR